MRSLAWILKTRRGITPFDPTNWIQRTSDSGNYCLTSSGYGNNIFSIGGSNESIQTAESSDISLWTQRLIGSGVSWAVKHYNGLWIAVGSDNESALFTSTDPESLWTERATSFGASRIYCVAYGNGLWVIVGKAGKLETSPDGITWTQRVSSFGSTDIICVVYGNGIWVAVGGAGKLATSTDGINWTQRTSQFGTDSILSVAYGNGYLVIVGVSGQISTSTDGINWTSRAVFGTSHLASVLYGSGYWLIQQTALGIIYTTTDPTAAWNSQDLSSFTKNGYNYFGNYLTSNGISYDSDNGIWVLVGNNAATQGMILTCSAPLCNVSYSANSLPASANEKSIGYGNGNWVYLRNNSSSQNSIMSSDGNPLGPWIERKTMSSPSLYYVAYGNGYWVATGLALISSVPALYTTYTVTSTSSHGPWTVRSNVPTSTANWTNEIEFGDGKFVLGGRNGAVAVATNPEGTFAVSNSGLGHIIKIFYGDGYWIATNFTTSSSPFPYSIGVTISPSGAWSNKYTAPAGYAVNDIAYGGGYWVATCYDTTAYPQPSFVVTATSPNGPWVLNSTSGLNNGIRHIKHNGSCFIVTGEIGFGIATAKNPTGAWVHSTTTAVPSTKYSRGIDCGPTYCGIIYDGTIVSSP